MSVVYPGLVNVDNSPITVTTINVYDEGQRTYMYDLSDQFPAWDATLQDSNGNPLTGQDLINAQTPLTTVTLPSSAKAGTLMIILDGLTLSPQLTSGGLGDYKIVNSTTVEFLWIEEQKPRRHSATDTPVLLARYTLA